MRSLHHSLQPLWRLIISMKRDELRQLESWMAIMRHKEAAPCAMYCTGENQLHELWYVPVVSFAGGGPKST